MKKTIIILLATFAYIHLQAQQCAILDAGTDVTVTPADNCTTLSGSFNNSGIGASSATYTIVSDSICNFTPPGNVQTMPTLDDVWSDAIALPFDFEFFGQPQDSLIIGGNGVLSFDLNRTTPSVQQPNEYCSWQFSDTLPSTNMFRNAIFGAYHDLDLTYGGNINYYVEGTAPARRFVVEFDSVRHYSCTAYYTTQYIILNETSNIIDVYIEHKDVCTSWNNGLAVVGIQNEDGDLAYVPPGRNTGQWEVTTPELWRFIPDTNPQVINPDFVWYDDATNTVLGTGLQLDVCVNQDTTYRLEATFTHPVTGQSTTISDTVTVLYDTSNDIKKENQNFFQIIPNPANNVCLIKLGNTNNTDAVVNLLDLTGKSIQKFSIRNSEITMDLSNLEKGIYLVQITMNNKVYISKLLKH